MKEILSSSAKANKAISWFIDIFWLNFFQRLWKFRCEVMNEWKKKKEINIDKQKYIKEYFLSIANMY